jgi:hypothetical protein
MSLGQLAASYAFLSTYVPCCVVPVKQPGLPRLLAALPAIAVCLYSPALVPWVSLKTSQCVVDLGTL